MRVPTLTAVSLFAGCGGMDLGFKRAGFDIRWANDFDKDACETYRQQIGAHIHCGDIGRVDPSEIPDADLLFGGPPCQGFSVAGHMDPYDPRSRLVWEFVRFVYAKRPKMFVMENVRSLGALQKWAPLRDALLAAWGNMGYKVEFKVLNSADYGVPQKRERVFFIGTRLDDVEIEFPAPTHEGRWRTVRDAIEDLPAAGLPGNEGECTAEITITRYPVLRRSPYAGMLVNGQGRPINADAPAPTMHASMGGNKTPIIDLAQFSDPEKEPWIVAYRRSLDAGAVPGLCEPPASWRRITVREAARIQTFPDGFSFCGKRSSQFRQVGNAVPVKLAEAVGRSVAETLRRAKLENNSVHDAKASRSLQLAMFAS